MHRPTRAWGIRHLTTFAVWIDADYMKRFGEPGAIQEYSQTLRQQPKTSGDGAAPGRFEQRWACLIEYGRTPRVPKSVLGLENDDGADADFSLCVFNIGPASRRNYLVDSTKDQLSLRSCAL